jgi:proteic killer suppression protein
MMEVRHADRNCERIEAELAYSGGFGHDLVRSYRKKMQLIRAAANEQDFYAMKSLHYEKLKGRRSHQRSMRLNDQFRLIIQLEKKGGQTMIAIVGIEDYH